MKLHPVTACVIFLMTISALSPAQQAPTSAHLRRSGGPSIGEANQMNVNRVHLTLTNKGGLDYSMVPSVWLEGWKYYEWDFPIFDQGLWVTGKRNEMVGSLPYLWASPYAPGPTINGRPALDVYPQDSARYRAYKITRGETSDVNPDINEWPSDLGAPLDPLKHPRILGDQTLWMVYNGFDTASAKRNWNYIRMPSPQIVLPVEVRQTVFAHFGEVTDTSIWANSVFFEWAIYNKGADPLDSVYLTLWTDLDFLEENADIPAIDTLSQTGYCWYKGDSSYAAAGYTLLYGPVVQSPGDNAVFFGKNKPGYKNLPLSAFWPIQDDSTPDGSNVGPPYSLKTAWNVVRGFKQSGAPIIDSSTRRATKFPFSGDPITGNGSVCPWPGTGGGAGFMMTAGPCMIAPGDSQWIMMSFMPSVKLGGIDAITHLRMNAGYLQSLPYDSLVAWKARRAVPAKPLPSFAIPASFMLHQNYPNPFNNSTTIPFDIPEMSRVRIEVVNVLGQVLAALVDDVLERGHRTISWYPTGPSGVYFIRVTAASVESAQRWTGVQKIILMK